MMKSPILRYIYFWKAEDIYFKKKNIYIYIKKSIYMICFVLPKYEFKGFFSTLTFCTLILNSYTLYTTLNYTQILQIKIPRK